MLKIFHAADFHFNEKDHDEIRKCVLAIVDDAKAEKPDLINVSGDLTHAKTLNFDSNSARSILEIIPMLLDIAPVAIIIGTDSHDGKTALALRNCRGKYPILVSDMPGQYGYHNVSNSWYRVEDPVGEPDFIITQLPQPSKQFFINDLNIEDSDKAIGDAMGTLFASFGYKASEYPVPHIANGHFQVGGAFISETQQLSGRDIEVSRSQLDMLNADVVCLGHIHKSQKIGENIFYSGSPTRMNYGETEKKGYYIHDITKAGAGFSLESEFIETPAREMISAKFDLIKKSKGDTEIPIMTTLESLAESLGDDFPEYHIKLDIKCWQDEHQELTEAAVMEVFIEAESVKVSIIRSPRETVRAIKVLEAEKMPDKLVAMAELRGETVKPSILEKAAAIEASETPWTLKLEQIKRGA